MFSLKLISVSALVFLFSFVIIIGCNTFDADYERDNTHDPGSTYFTPRLPSGFTAKAVEGEIEISWSNASSNLNGFIIEKAINDTSNFNYFSTISPESRSFLDLSRKIGKKTFYKITPFIIKDDTITYKSNIVEIQIPIIADISVRVQHPIESNTRISVNYINSEFAEKIIIERKGQNEEYSTIDNNENWSNYYDDVFDIEDYTIYYRLNVIQVHNDSLFILEQHEDSAQIFKPAPSFSDIVNEEAIRFQWEIEGSFHEKFEIFRSDRNPNDSFFSEYTSIGFADGSRNSFIDRTKKKNRQVYYYKVQAHNGTKKSKLSSPPSSRSIYISEPILELNTRDSDTPSNLKWYSSDNINWGNRIRGFELERKTNEGEFELVAELGMNSREYEDLNVNINNKYSYRVKTLTSDYSNEISIGYNEGYLMSDIDQQTIYESNDQYRYPYIHSINEGNELAIYQRRFMGRHLFSSKIYFLDSNNLNVLSEFRSGLNYFSTAFTPNGQNILQLVSDGNIDLYSWNKDDSNNFLWKIENLFYQNSYQSGSNFAEIDINFNGNLAACFYHRDSSIQIIDIVIGEILFNLTYEPNSIFAIKFHPNSNILSVSHKNGFDVWNLDEQELIFNIQRETDINDYFLIDYITPTNQLVVTENNLISVIDLNTGNKLFSRIFENNIYLINISSDGHYISLLIGQHLTYLVDSETLETVQIIDINPNLTGFQFVPEYPNIAFSVRKIRFEGTKVEKWNRMQGWYPIN